MKKPKEKKKLTKKKQASLARTVKKKLLTDWSKKVRDRDDNKCTVCGSEKFLNAHHILPKENYHNLMYEVTNGITLCPTHHKFGKNSAHKNAIWFCEFLKNYNTEQYNWAVNNMNS